MINKIHKELEFITSYLTKDEKDKVIHALKLSEEAHSNQLRKSGDPFIKESFLPEKSFPTRIFYKPKHH